MLEIRTYKNFLVKDTDKDGYCFKSNCNQILSQEQLVKEFSDYNSTITEPDALSMLSILNTLVCKYVARGYVVELPFCRIYAKAVGTTGSIKNSFQPGLGNNRFEVVVEMTDGATLAMTTAVEYKLLPPEKVTAPRIVEVCLLDANAQESRDLSASPGGAVRIHGNNIKADLSDSTQGVFLVAQDKSQTRMAKYTRNGTNVIDFMLPADLGTGTYTVLFVNKSDNGTVQESKYAEAITVA